MPDDTLLEQLATLDHTADPGGDFGDRLWSLVEDELFGRQVLSFPEPPVGTAPAGATAAARHGIVHRLSARRSVGLVAAAAAVLSLSIGALLSGGNPHGKDSLIITGTASPSPSQPSTLPAPRPNTGPQSVPTYVGSAAPAATGGPAALGPALAPQPGAAASLSDPSVWAVLYGDNSLDPNSDSDLHLAVAGSRADPVTLVSGPARDSEPQLSPNGRELVWAHWLDYHTFEVWVGGPDGRNGHALVLPKCGENADCGYSWPTISPDGTQLAFTHGEGYAGCSAFKGCDEIYVYSRRSAAVTSVAHGTQADWSPRRSEIAYSGHSTSEEGNTESLPYYNTVTVAGEIRVVDVSGATPVARSIGGELGWRPRFSPDGEWIAFQRYVRSSNSQQAAVIRRDGTGLRVLPTGCGQPGWAPDGRLVCSMAVGGGSDLFLLGAGDDPVRRLTFTKGPEADFRIYAR